MRSRATAFLLLLAATAVTSSALAGPFGGSDSSRVPRASVTRASPSAREGSTKRAADANKSATQRAESRPASSRPTRWARARRTIAGVAIGGAVVGMTAGVGAAALSWNTSQVGAYESVPYVQIANAAPGSMDAKFNTLASQVHQVSSKKPGTWPGKYHDPTEATRAGFHELTSALLHGDLGRDPKYVKTAITIGQSLTHDLQVRAIHERHPIDTFTVETDTAALQAKLAETPGR